MEDFIKSLETYWKEAPLETFSFWAIPIGTIVCVWLLTTIGLKIFSKRKQVKMLFLIHKAWIISSLLVACAIISIICYCWTQNTFSEHHYQLALLIALIIALLIPLIAFATLRRYYTGEGIKEITDQPKTIQQMNVAIPLIKRVFERIKFYYLIPLLGFLFLLFYLNKGTNLIAIVFDNSGSMTQTDAINALSETFDKLEENNEIVLTTLDGPDYKPKTNAKTSMGELMKVKKSSDLFAGNCVPFQNPKGAQTAVLQIQGFECCSPIAESIWKTYLFIKETKTNEIYKHKLLIALTDGLDNYIDESLKTTSQFLFDDKDFTGYFTPENVFVIDYSDSPSTFVQRCIDAGCDVYSTENNKEDYLDALDNALQSFKNNWYLIYWTILIFSIFTLTGLLISPKKIV